MSSIQTLVCLVVTIAIVGCASQSSTMVEATSLDPRYIYVDGEVAAPGVKVWADGVTLLQTIELSGGLTAAADRNALVVVRRDGTRETFSLSSGEMSPFIHGGDRVLAQRAKGFKR